MRRPSAFSPPKTRRAPDAFRRDHRLRLAGVVPGDVSALHQGDAHGREVARVHDVRENLAVRVLLRRAHHGEAPRSMLAQGDRVDEPDPLDPGDGRHPVGESGVEVAPLAVRCEALARLSCHATASAGSNPRSSSRTARKLRTRSPPATRSTHARVTSATTNVSRRRRAPRPAVLPRPLSRSAGTRPTAIPVSSATGAAKRSADPLDGDATQERDPDPRRSGHKARRRPGQAAPEHRPGKGDPQRLQHGLSDEAAPRRTERQPEGHLARPSRRARGRGSRRWRTRSGAGWRRWPRAAGPPAGKARRCAPGAGGATRRGPHRPRRRR